MSKHTSRCRDRVKCGCLAARATLAPQPCNREHPLAALYEETRQAATERCSAFKREGAAPRRRAPGRAELLKRVERVRHDNQAGERSEDARPADSELCRAATKWFAP